MSSKKMFKWILVLSVFTVIILTSCNNNSCYETSEVKVFCGFYTSDSIKKVAFDSMTVWGVGSDSLIYDNKKVSELALELNPKAGITQYVVQVQSKKVIYTDTITLYHTNQPWFQSMDCGCMVFSTLDSCRTTGRIFKSVSISDSIIINKKTEHVVLKV